MNDTGTGARSSHPALSLADGLASATTDTFLLIGRILMALIFIESGFGKLMNIPAFVATMAKRGLPDWLGYIAPFVEFFGGLALLFGFATRYTAILMLAFTLIATFSSHAYWTYPVDQQGGQKINFFKNITIMGAFLVLFAIGAGRFSLDRLMRGGRT